MKAIIIGATSGIGLEVARRLHRDGWTLGLAGRREERLLAAQQEMGSRVAVRRIDVCAEDAGAQLLELIEQTGGADLIFLASGCGRQNPSMAEDIELSTARTNVEGFMRIMTTAYHYFAQKGGGRIAAITSIAGTKGLGVSPAYSATKRFQRHYIQSLSQLSYIQRAGIRFTEIRPGFVDTDMLAYRKYPMLLRPEKVAAKIVKALYARRRKITIDWRYALLTFIWELIPDFIWERLRIQSPQPATTTGNYSI